MGEVIWKLQHPVVGKLRGGAVGVDDQGQTLGQAVEHRPRGLPARLRSQLDGDVGGGEIVAVQFVRSKARDRHIGPRFDLGVQCGSVLAAAVPADENKLGPRAPAGFTGVPCGQKVKASLSLRQNPEAADQQVIFKQSKTCARALAFFGAVKAALDRFQVRDHGHVVGYGGAEEITRKADSEL